jgi:hypothetical protein
MQNPLAQVSERKNRVLQTGDSNNPSDNALLQTFTETLQNHIATQLQSPIQDSETQSPKELKRLPKKGAVQDGINQAFRSINGKQ